MLMKSIALIVAAGSGQRYSSGAPKQYDYIDGVSILETTIKKFLLSNYIDSVQVVIRPEDLDLYQQITKHLDLLPICFGGDTRADSVRNGLKAIDAFTPEFVLIHDAARPYISTNLIDSIAKKLLAGNVAVVPKLIVPETVKRIDGDIVEVIDRDKLFLMQTPQGFNFRKIYDLSMKDKRSYTDESSLFDAYNLPVEYIPGEKHNIKITNKEDVVKNLEVRSGIGFDAHRFSLEESEHNYITLGGIKIAYLKKLEAHSDGDVLIHALVDAIFGTIGAGDIGMHFPPSDAKWKNTDSKLFLEYANKLLQDKNGRINNIDITVICEKPRLGEYREMIRENLANILNISNNRINIKATTTEKMGFTGRGEGIAVQAIATVSL